MPAATVFEERDYGRGKGDPAREPGSASAMTTESEDPFGEGLAARPTRSRNRGVASPAPQPGRGRRLLAESIELQHRFAESMPALPEHRRRPALHAVGAATAVLLVAGVVLLVVLAFPAHS